MNIRLRGKSVCLPSSEVRYAVRHMAQMLMSRRLCDSINLTIQFVDDLTDAEDDNTVIADIEWLDDNHSPRDFKIRISNRTKSKRNQLISLAHELVHLKQYARNEMKDVFRGPTPIKWKKEFINDEKVHYYDLPWEIEAHGRELGLYKRYQQHRKRDKLKFKS